MFQLVPPGTNFDFLGKTKICVALSTVAVLGGLALFLATPEVEKLGIDSRASLLARACDALLRDPERALPQRAVIVHGFADATGVIRRNAGAEPATAQSAELD